MSQLTELDTMKDIESMLEATTPEQIERCGAKLDKQENGEKPLGVIHNEFARKLFTVSSYAKGRAAVFGLETSMAADKVERKRLKIETMKMTNIADITREIFWDLVRRDMDIWKDTIGVRRGWMMVARGKSNSGMPQGLLDILKSKLVEKGLLPPDADMEIEKIELGGSDGGEDEEEE